MSFSESYTLKFLDLIIAFEGWDYDRQTTAIENIRALGEQYPESAGTLSEMAAIMTRMREKAHPEKTKAA